MLRKRMLLGAVVAAASFAVALPGTASAAECGDGLCDRRELNSPRHCCFEDCGFCRTPPGQSTQSQAASPCTANEQGVARSEAHGPSVS